MARDLGHSRTLCTQRGGNFSEARQTETREGEFLRYRDRKALFGPRVRRIVLSGISGLKEEPGRDKELPILQFKGEEGTPGVGATGEIVEGSCHVHDPGLCTEETYSCGPCDATVRNRAATASAGMS